MAGSVLGAGTTKIVECNEVKTMWDSKKWVDFRAGQDKDLSLCFALGKALCWYFCVLKLC